LLHLFGVLIAEDSLKKSSNIPRVGAPLHSACGAVSPRRSLKNQIK
jgi:hypothetical protein